jgi:hypothetical protein
MSLKVREGGQWIKVSDGANGANGLDGTDAKVLQEQYEDSNTVRTISQQNVSPITELSINISPIKTTTKLLLEANIMSNAYYVSSFGFALLQGLTWIPIGGNTNSNSFHAISTLFSYGDFVAGTTSNVNPSPPGVFSSNYLAENMYSVTYRYLYTQLGPSPVGGLTFAPTACSSRYSFVYPLTINNRLNNDMLSTSSITVTEIEV